MNSLEKKNKNKLSLRGILRLLTFPFWLSYAIIKLLKQVTATAKWRAFRKTSYLRATLFAAKYDYFEKNDMENVETFSLEGFQTQISLL